MTQDIEKAYGWSSQQEGDGNRLRGIDNCKLTVSPAAADVWFRVAVQRVTAGTEVRGRVVGPRSLYQQQRVESWPMRSVRHREQAGESLIARTAIPEPGLWSPDNPLLYRVVVELWQDRQLCEVCGFDLGFRRSDMGPGDVLVNQKPVHLQGMTCLPESRDETLARRQAGYNLVLAGLGQWHWWVRASPMGFFLLERVALATLTPQYISLLCQQPCFLGFVLDQELLGHSLTEMESFLRPWQESGVLIGMELAAPPTQALPTGLSFLLCPEADLPALSAVSLPKIALRQAEAGSGQTPGRGGQGMLGWIDLP
jgi:hypothetical protein